MCDLCWYHVYDFIVTIIIIMTTTTTTTTISSSHVMAPDQRVQMLMKGLAQMDGGGEGEGVVGVGSDPHLPRWEV